MPTLTKSISSQPEAAKFRSIIVIILVLICTASFLSFTSHLSDKVEVLARERVITDIKQSLAMMLYDYSIKGKQQQLEQFHQDNPFVPLAIYRTLPRNYHGVVSRITNGKLNNGWYYERKSKKVIYLALSGKRYEYVMRYVRSDSIGQLQLQKI